MQPHIQIECLVLPYYQLINAVFYARHWPENLKLWNTATKYSMICLEY